MTSSPTTRDPARETAARRALGALSAWLLLAWLVLMLPLPWSLGAGVVAVVAFVQLVRSTRTVWRAGLRAPAVASAVLGLGAVLTLLGATALSVLFYGPMLELQECRADAITHASQDRCETQAARSTMEWISSRLGS